MKIIDQQVHEFKETPTDFEGCLSLIEKAGRTCYGSTDKTTETSARPFVEGLIKRGHLSVLRHSNLICVGAGHERYLNTVRHNKEMYTGGNIQAWLEFAMPYKKMGIYDLGGIERLYYINQDVSQIHPELKRYTAHITTSLRNSHQLVRHTTLAVSQKSTRYIDHSNLEVIKPWWWGKSVAIGPTVAWKGAMEDAEANYHALQHNELSKEDAADVLPKATASELWLTGDRAAWLNLKAQRLDGTTGKPSKQMQALMSQMPWEVIE